MAEPTSSAVGISIAALAIALVGPLAGPYAVIVFSALAGSLWPLSTVETSTRAAGAWLVVRCTMTSVFMTGGAASYLHSAYGIQVTESIAPVAFILSALGNGWRTVIDSVSGILTSIAKRFGSPTSGADK